MKLSDLDLYIIDMVSDDYYCLWEVIAYDDYLVETGIGHDPAEIKKSAEKLISNGLIDVVFGNLDSENVKILSKADALTILRQENHWKKPSRPKAVYALYATDKGEKLAMAKVR
ncbi:MAG: hypothetical protein COA93_08130 [Alphaproteobacteria bacterium]|nr:MAG: hypothetical protein COA93_08130 [Alphaproteobacteria bacterium]